MKFTLVRHDTQDFWSQGFATRLKTERIPNRRDSDYFYAYENPEWKPLSWYEQMSRFVYRCLYFMAGPKFVCSILGIVPEAFQLHIKIKVPLCNHFAINWYTQIVLGYDVSQLVSRRTLQVFLGMAISVFVVVLKFKFCRELTSKPSFRNCSEIKICWAWSKLWIWDEHFLKKRMWIFWIHC